MGAAIAVQYVSWRLARYARQATLPEVENNPRAVENNHPAVEDHPNEQDDRSLTATAR
jgi:hypothetical protein